MLRNWRKIATLSRHFISVLNDLVSFQDYMYAQNLFDSSEFIPGNMHWLVLHGVSAITLNFPLLLSGFLLLKSQDDKSRARKRKRGRNMWNPRGNTTVNRRFPCRFVDVYSRFRCCGHGSVLLFLHVSVRFQLKETSVSVPFTDGFLLYGEWEIGEWEWKWEWKWKWKLKCRTGNGERETRNGEWGKGNRQQATGNGQQATGNGQRALGSFKIGNL